MAARPRVRAAGAALRKARARSSGAAAGLALGLALALGPATVRAETAVLLPHRGDDGLVEQRQQAQQVLSQTLAAQGIRVLSVTEAASQISGGGAAAECTTLDCAPALLQASGADSAAVLALWATGSPPVPGTVFVTLVDRRGDRYPGKATIDHGDFAAATKQALLDARALQLLGPGPWLRVHAKPDGAQVVLNGKLVGTTPYRAAVASGRYTLEVRAKGSRSYAQTVDVPPNEARQVEVDVALKPRAGEAAAAGPVGPDAFDLDADTGAEPSRPVVGPLILGGMGVAALTYDVVALAGSGCDHREPSGACTKKTEINAAPAAIFGVVGVGAIAGAALWYLLGEQEPAGEARVSLAPGPGSLNLKGSF